MTTTKRSNFSAALRTTLLLAGLGGLLVVIGALVGGPKGAAGSWSSPSSSTSACIGSATGSRSPRRAPSPSPRRKTRGLRDGPRPDDPRRPADAEALRDSPGAAERLRHRPQPEALGGRGDGRDPQAPLRGRAARRARARARPCPQPRHPVDLGRLGDRHGDHLDRLHAALVRWRRRLALGAIASIALVLLAPLAAGIIQMAISRQREFSADATGAEICGNPESLASALCASSPEPRRSR